jgi:ABC-type uncharacterized transport system auxiliary subunit
MSDSRSGFSRSFTLGVIALGIFAPGGSLVGCGSMKPIKYYHLTYPSESPVSEGAIDATIMVRPFETSHLYLDDKIVYGFSSPEMGTYEYQRWEEPPVEMLQNALVRGLRSSGKFGGVYTIRAEANAQYTLSGHLYDFKEVEGESILARLNYEVRLRDRKSGIVVWTHSYHHDEPAAQKSMSSFVEAMDRDVNRSVQEVQAGLLDYFQAHPPKR